MSVGAGAEYQREESYVAQGAMRPADLSPADSHTCQEAIHVQGKRTHKRVKRRKNSPCGVHKLGDYFCSYKSELKDSQWSYKTVKCLIFKEGKPHNP